MASATTTKPALSDFDRYTFPYSKTNPRPEPTGERPHYQGVGDAEHYSADPEPDPLACPNCKTGEKLRARGTRVSRRDPDDVRQIVICIGCDSYMTLPIGLRLPEKPREHPLMPQADVASDPRPACPHCGSTHIWRRGTINVGRDRKPGGSQRWGCADCSRRFVTDPYQHTPAKALEKETLVDRRHYWNPHKGRTADDVREEAAALFQLALNSSDFDGIRFLIVFTPLEQYVARFFCAAGLVDEMRVFREEVLVEYDALVAHSRQEVAHDAQD